MFDRILNLWVFFSAIPLYFCDSPCVTHTPCSCQLRNGPVINLSSLGLSNGTARFSDVLDLNNNNTYSYNPCYAFTEGGTDFCTNVAACQKTANNEFYNLGAQTSAEFFMNGSDLKINYTAYPRIFSVSLVCDSAEEGILTSNGEYPINHYSFTLRSKCACPNGCVSEDLSESSLSTGSILVILLLVFSLCYLLGGMIFQKIIKGATGVELFPNYDFWIDFPLLVRDGIIFTCNGCQPEASYNRI